MLWSMKMHDLPAARMPPTKCSSFSVSLSEAHRWLVEDDDVCLEMKRPDDRETLTFPARQAGYGRVGGQCRRREAHRFAHQPRRDLAHLAHLEEAETPADRSTHEDVPPQGQLLGQGAFLVHGFDAQGSGALDVEVVNGLAIEEHLRRPDRGHR